MARGDVERIYRASRKIVEAQNPPNVSQRIRSLQTMIGDDDQLHPTALWGAVPHQVLTFFSATTFAVADNIAEEHLAPWGGMLSAVYVRAKLGPTGSMAIARVRKNGVSWFTVNIPTGTQQVIIGQSLPFAALDLFQLDITQRGSTVAGQGITLHLIVKPDIRENL